MKSSDESSDESFVTIHKQKHIKVGDMEDDVDEGIADLIEQLWIADIDTVMSCQDNDGKDGSGKIWIEFFDQYEVEKFLGIVVDYEKDPFGMYNRVCYCFDDDGEPIDEKLCWTYRLSIMTDRERDIFNIERAKEKGKNYVPKYDGKETGGFELRFSIRFPHCDYKHVLDRMIKYNKSCK